MKATLSILLSFLAAVSAFAAAPVPDITGANDAAFKAHLGQAVTIHGRLAEGVQGLCLNGGATGKGVTFYIIAEMPPSGVYTEPASISKLLDKQVRVTGELHYRPSPKPAHPDPLMQRAPDYYYMVAQRTKIEPIK